jgi:hypothetical protein
VKTNQNGHHFTQTWAVLAFSHLQIMTKQLTLPPLFKNLAKIIDGAAVRARRVPRRKKRNKTK